MSEPLHMPTPMELYRSALDRFAEARFEVYLDYLDGPDNYRLRWRKRGSKWYATGTIEAISFNALAWLDSRHTGEGDSRAFAVKGWPGDA